MWSPALREHKTHVLYLKTKCSRKYLHQRRVKCMSNFGYYILTKVSDIYRSPDTVSMVKSARPGSACSYGTGDQEFIIISGKPFGKVHFKDQGNGRKLLIYILEKQVVVRIMSRHSLNTGSSEPLHFPITMIISYGVWDLFFCISLNSR